MVLIYHNPDLILKMFIQLKINNYKQKDKLICLKTMVYINNNCKWYFMLKSFKVELKHGVH